MTEDDKMHSKDNELHPWDPFSGEASDAATVRSYDHQNSAEAALALQINNEESDSDEDNFADRAQLAEKLALNDRVKKEASGDHPGKHERSEDESSCDDDELQISDDEVQSDDLQDDAETQESKEEIIDKQLSIPMDGELTLPETESRKFYDKLDAVFDFKDSWKTLLMASGLYLASSVFWDRQQDWPHVWLYILIIILTMISVRLIFFFLEAPIKYTAINFKIKVKYILPITAVRKEMQKVLWIMILYLLWSRHTPLNMQRSAETLYSDHAKPDENLKVAKLVDATKPRWTQSRVIEFWLVFFILVVFKKLVCQILVVWSQVSFKMVLCKQTSNLINRLQYLYSLDVSRFWHVNAAFKQYVFSQALRVENNAGSPTPRPLWQVESSTSGPFAFTENEISTEAASNWYAIEYIRERGIVARLESTDYTITNTRDSVRMARLIFLSLVGLYDTLNKVLKLKDKPQNYAGHERYNRRRAGITDIRTLQEARYKSKAVDSLGINNADLEAVELPAWFFEFFMRSNSVRKLFQTLNIAKNQNIRMREFVRFFIDLQLDRKQLMSSVDAREEIMLIIKRLISCILYAFCIMIFLIILGYDSSTVFAIAGTMVVSVGTGLGIMYTNFFKSMSLILFHDPYNMGDRIRINGGELLIVKKILTFVTAFETLQGKPVLYPNSILTDACIQNESRSKNAHIKLEVLVPYLVPDLELIVQKVREYCNARPEKFLLDTVTSWLTTVELNMYPRFSIWVCLTEGWGQTKTVFQVSTEFNRLIMNLLQQHNIVYHEPRQEVFYHKAEKEALKHKQ